MPFWRENKEKSSSQQRMLYALVIAKIAMSRARGRVIKVPLMISPDVDAIQKLLPSTCRK